MTSGLFRKEFYSILRRCLGHSNTRVGVVTQMIGQTTQTQMIGQTTQTQMIGQTTQTQMGLTQFREKRNRQELSMETAQ